MKKINLLLALTIFWVSTFSQAPVVSSFSPVSGPVGTLVTITGTNLNSPITFTIGGVPALIISDNGTTLVGMVMPGAATGTVSVGTTGGSATAGRSYTLTTSGYASYQQGTKLLGTNEVNLLPNGGPNLGYSVAVSADGNTALVGGPQDNGPVGAVWAYTRSGSTWTQQGTKLVDLSLTGGEQGYSVAISANGNTAVVGVPDDSTGSGAVLIYTRTGNTWTQQGGKLVGTGATWSNISGAEQGYSVAVSADGNTIIAGGPDDRQNSGAAWIFVRTGTTWAQQGPKLMGTGLVGSAIQGGSVGISADGNTAILGGRFDNGGIGAAWVYTRIDTVWTQQGSKLVGTGAIGTAYEGSAVALSADGNTAILGSMGDNNDSGAVWIFTRSDTTWSQQGSKLVGTGASGTAQQGISVALSADGNTAMVGGAWDASDTGAVWIFTRMDTVWSQHGSKLVGIGAVGRATQGTSVALSADGTTAIVGGPADDDVNGTGAAWIFAADSGGSAACLPTSSLITRTICPGDTFVWANTPYFTTGYYTDTLINAGGCDSVMSLYLFVLDSSTAYFYLQPADSPHVWYIVLPSIGNNVTYTWNWGDSSSSIGDTVSHTYASAGYYNICLTVTDSAGCFATYCDTNVYLYKNQSGQMIYVHVLQYPTGITETNAASNINIFPNPNKGSFTLQTSGSIGSEYSITNTLGQIIAQQTIRRDQETIEMTDVADGVYTLTVKGASPQRFVIMK